MLDRLGAAAAAAAWAATVAAIPARNKDVGGGPAGCCGRCFGKFGFSFDHSLAPIGKVIGALEVTFAASQLPPAPPATPIGKVRGAFTFATTASQLPTTPPEGLPSCSSSLTAPGQRVGDVNVRLFFAF